ncbi:MAG: hypothetical protein RSE13_08140 [Planktothrix sp. GU0601_MAG3]|nr:MAG: hypothetical protein RSE13_08140 [Planktothrix sp. GU0601_MAG3]
MEHFAFLKSKYQATDYENSSLSSLLYLILRKADLGMNINEIEWNWLLDNQLLETIESLKRGASPKDQDAEMKQIVKNAKDENKRREVVEYLLKKDPNRYAWAKSYLKKPKNLGK